MFCGFWGLKIVPGKTYSQTVDASFRVSNAALGETIGDSGRTSVLLTVDDKSYVLCSLTPGKIEQQSLDISLTGGEEITFESTGKNEIHLTGNFIIEEDDTNEGSESDDDDAIDFSKLSPEQVQELIDGGYINPEDVLQSLGGEDDSDDDYDSEDAEADAQRIIEMDSDDLEVDAEEELEKEVKIKESAKDAKKRKLAQEQEAAAKEEKKRKIEEAKAKKAEKAEKAEKAAEKAKAKKPKQQKLAGGVIAEDKKEGTGDGVKKGARVGMHYIGKLTNGKVFDQNTKGKPFWFRLGVGEVIKGWDVGVAGMKRGGERRLTIPAAMAYGKRGAPPDIPPHATLVFDVRLMDFKK